MEIQIEERDRALRLGGIELWLQQVQRVHYKAEWWNGERAAALAMEAAMYGFQIGYEAAKEGIAAGWEACLMNEQIEMRGKNERL